MILSVVMLIAVSSTVQANFLTLNQIGEASCRVRVSGAAGSGTAISQDDQYIYVLTNAHVVGSNKSATCEFFRYGRKTERLPGQVTWKSHSDRTVNDFAIIKISKNHFGRYPPRIAPIAPEDHAIRRNDYIASAGCPQARWLQLWEGHALSDASNNRVLFTPPPLGGQSGSGVYTVIDGSTYLVAVLTWKIGENGGAIHIGNFLKASKGNASSSTLPKVPSSWKYINAEVKEKSKDKVKTHQRLTGYYALGSDGLYYCQTFKNGKWYQEVTTPDGITVKEWNIKITQDCPGGICPPIINPNRPKPPTDNGPSPPPGDGDNPYGILPPNWGNGGGDDGAKDKEIEELKKTNESLQLQISELIKERDGLSTGMTDLNTLLKEKESILAALNQQVNQLKESGSASKEEIDTLNSQIYDLNGQIADLNLNISLYGGQIKGLEESLDKKSGVLNDLIGDYENLNIEKEEVKSQRNIFAWLFGGTGGGGLIWFLTWYWKLRGKKKVKDMIEDKVNPENISNAVNDKIDRVEEEKLGKNHSLEGVIDFLQERLEKVIQEKIGSLTDSIHTKIDSLEVAATRDVDVRVYNNQIDDKDTVQSEKSDDEVPVMKSPSAKEALDNQNESLDDFDCCEELLDLIGGPHFPPVSDRIKEFIDLKQSDGERVEELAFYAHLYKEAVTLLKRDRLIVTEGGKSHKVNNQAKAGDAIESHVQTEFLRRVSSATINRHILYHEAMIGFLYRQAVGRLKRGEFNVLGYKDIAKAIEKWVKTEFLKRMGFSF